MSVVSVNYKIHVFYCFFSCVYTFLIFDYDSQPVDTLILIEGLDELSDGSRFVQGRDGDAGIMGRGGHLIRN